MKAQVERERERQMLTERERERQMLAERDRQILAEGERLVRQQHQQQQSMAWMQAGSAAGGGGAAAGGGPTARQNTASLIQIQQEEILASEKVRCGSMMSIIFYFRRESILDIRCLMQRILLFCGHGFKGVGVVYTLSSVRERR